MNPYNFVRLRPMDADARRTPQWHSGGDPDLHSGTLVCQLVALGRLVIPDHDSDVRLEPVPGTDRTHRIYNSFFSRGDGVPTIPGSSLKGAIRAVAEAAGNGCLSILGGRYKPRPKSNKVGKPRYNKPFDIMPAIEQLGLQPCDHVARVDGDPDTGLCPTCRLFGMPSAADGSSQAGQRPDFFAGKVSIGDARLVSEAVYVNNPITLIELAAPDATSYLYYEDSHNHPDDYELGTPRGRKFYYHHLSVKINNDPDGKERRVSVRPLLPGAVFTFEVTYQNLTDEELQLLLFALELDAAHPVNPEDRTPGARHKIGYGKPAGLGSAAIVVERWRQRDWRAYYLGEAAGEVDGDLADIATLKRAFIEAHRQDDNLNDLRRILRWPNSGDIKYPALQEFGVTKPLRLPRP